VFNAGCVLTDCSVNCNDSEIREIAGQPLVDVPVYVRLGYGAVANNLTLFNVNQYIQTVLLSGVGLVELYNEVSPATYPQTSLTGLRVYFTATAAHAGAVGTKYLSNYITVTAINVAVRDFVSPTTNLPSTGISPLGSQTGVAYLQASNLQHYTDYYAPIVCPAGITVNYSSFEDCLFGRGINGCTEIVGVPLPSGVSNTFKNIDFLAYVGSNLAGGFQIPLLANDYMLNNVRLSTPSAVGTGTGLFNGVVGANYYRWIFTGCRFYLNATAAGTKNFLVDGTFNDGSVNIDLSCVGAGNVWVYSGGTAGAPSFSARINTW
jgi:hypothetical protein